MKKIIIAALIVVIGVVGFMFVRNRLGISSSINISVPGQITLFNDSSDTISVEYKLGDQDVAMVLPPREEITCGNDGFVRVFTAQKLGSYELKYPVDDSVRQVNVSQIVASAKKDSVENEMYIKKGMIGDIKVEYEEAEQLAATY